MALSDKQAKARLQKFFANNPLTKVDDAPAPGKGRALFDLWGDPSVGLNIPADPKALFKCLNDVVLPERFTAIWHRSTSQFEVIYTAYPMTPNDDVKKRQFAFRFEGKEYKCRFGKSSDCLLLIAEHFIPTGVSGSTNFRNLGSFRRYIMSRKPNSRLAPIEGAEPISFWIEGITWNDDLVLRLVNHLNFYLAYFDTQSPYILVHAPRSENIATQPQSRFRFGPFPKTITSSKIDDNLIHFWEASRSGDPSRRFIYNYQILEYAAFYHIEEVVQKSVRRLLASPNALDNLEAATARILDAVSESKISDPQKIEAILRDTVDPVYIWNDIKLSMDFFSKETKFEGGFTTPALVKQGWTEADFKVNWLPSFSGSLRSIRNALSHGREQRMSAVIMPTRKNFERLQHWVAPISTAAQEIMIHLRII